MNYFRQTWWIHVILIVSVLLLPILFTPMGIYDSFGQMLSDPFKQFHIAIYVVMLGMLYLNYYVLLPRLYDQHKKITYILTLILGLIGICSLYLTSGITPSHFPPHLHHDAGFHAGPKHHSPPLMHLWQFIMFYGVGLFFTSYLRIRQKMSQLQTEQSKTQLKYLSSQINPHFLFNTFNSIYGLAIHEKANQTASGMLKLSEMMRYMVSETSNDDISLQTELNYLQNYIDLQKLRLTNNVTLTTKIEVAQKDLKIAPMILIPFIENAFKHGVNPDQVSEISISIVEKNKVLLFDVKNKKVVHNALEHEGLGLGIQNTLSRLKLMYPLRHDFKLNENEHDFQITLKLNLT